MKRLSLLLLFALAMNLSLSAQYRVTEEHKARAAEVVKKMTLNEKIAYIGGYESWYVRAIDRKFKVEAGSFTIKVGSSSADIRLTGKLEVK